MKKVLLSLSAVAVTYILVASTAAAMFFTSAEFTGISLSTSSLELLVSAYEGDNPTDFAKSAILLGGMNMQPGMTPQEHYFWVRANNSPGQKINMSVHFTKGTGDWEQLKDLVLIQIKDTTSDLQSDWLTLDQWQQTQDMPQPNLNASEHRKYVMRVNFPEVYSFDPDGEGPLQVGDPIGDEAMGLQLLDVKMVIEATPRSI